MEYDEAVHLLGGIASDAAERWVQTDPLLSDIDARDLARQCVWDAEKAIYDRGFAAAVAGGAIPTSASPRQ